MHTQLLHQSQTKILAGNYKLYFLNLSYARESLNLTYHLYNFIISQNYQNYRWRPDNHKKKRQMPKSYDPKLKYQLKKR